MLRNEDFPQDTGASPDLFIDSLESKMIIQDTVRERKRKYIIAYYHLSNAVRTFKRNRIKSIEPV